MYSCTFGVPPVGEFLAQKWSPRVPHQGLPRATAPELLARAPATEVRTILRKVKLADYGVLGEQISLSGQIVRNAPDPLDCPGRCVVVDPAGLPYIQHFGPRMAGAASGALYRWLGTNRDSQFPQAVVASVTRPGLAKLHVYGDASVIHAVGPDFRDRRMLGVLQEDAEIALIETYSNILREFVEGVACSERATLRLLPISGGVFSGRFKRVIDAMTFNAILGAIRSLSATQRAVLRGEGIELEMCVFDAREQLRFESAHQRAIDQCALADVTTPDLLDELNRRLT
jgi:hypothetical protein